jgi:hypothetical protein
MKVSAWRIVPRYLGLCALLLAPAVAASVPLGTDFTYQGQLNLAGSPVNGTADFQFKLFGQEAGGSQIGSTVPVNNVTVTGGVFTVGLDFGAGAFTGDQRWLEILVRSPAGGGSFVLLTPRQKLTASPYALQTRGVDGHSLDASDGSPVDALFVGPTGYVGIGTTNPETPLHVNGVLQWGGTTNYGWSGEDEGGLYLEQLGNTAATSRIRLQSSLSGNLGSYSQFFIDPYNGFAFTNIGSGNYNVGIGTTLPQAGLHVKKEPITPGGTLVLEGDTHTYMSFYPDGAAAGRKAFFGFAGADQNDMTMWNEIPGGSINLVTTGGGVTRVNVLEITGADLAEKFPTSDHVEPGMVVAIDSENAGKLCLARGAYNRCVAGVVSGANDFSAGAVLGNLPGHEDAPAIALSGRVYVWCDATSSPIQPGDPLTTSTTPGHAMKATDIARAPGAILGKAMTELRAGQGLVLALVNLQ